MSLSTEYDDEQERIRNAPTGDYEPTLTADIPDMEVAEQPSSAVASDSTDSEPPLPTGTVGAGRLSSVLGGDAYDLKAPRVDAELSSSISAAGPSKPQKFDYASILAEKPLPDSLNDDALAKAQKADRDSHYDTAISDALYAAATRSSNIPHSAAPPSRADDLLKHRQLAQQQDDKSRAARLQLAKMMQPKDEKAGKTPEELDLMKARAERERSLVGRDKAYAEDLQRRGALADSKQSDAMERETGGTFEANRDAAQKIIDGMGVKGVDLSGIKTQHELDKFIDKAGLSAIKGGLKKGGDSAGGDNIDKMAEALAKGRIDLKAVPQKVRAQVLAKALDKNANYDQAAFDIRKSGTSKVLGEKGVQATGVALRHLDEAEHLVDADQNFDAPTLNRIRQAYETGTGSDQLSGQQFALMAAAHEVAAAYGADTESGRHAIEVMFSPTASKKQKKEVLSTAKRFLAGKVAGSQESLERFDPNGVGGFKVMTPEIQRMLGDEKSGGQVKVRQKSTGRVLPASPDELKEIEGDPDFEVVR